MTLSTFPFAEFEQIYAAAIGRPPRLAEPDFRRFTTPEHFIAMRTMQGGPAPAPLAASFARYRAELTTKRSAIGASPRAAVTPKRCSHAKIAGRALPRIGERLRFALDMAHAHVFDASKGRTLLR